VEDLGATLFRVDPWGDATWPDPDGSVGPEALEPERLARVLSGEKFGKCWRMLRWLNERNIEPLLGLTGAPPRWMLADDGKTLARVDDYARMAGALVDWARRREGLRISAFGPTNETDLGLPEGPIIGPTAMPAFLEAVLGELDRLGHADLPLFACDQAFFGPDYLAELVRHPSLAKRLIAFSTHQYNDMAPERFRAVTDLVKDTPFAACRLWMTEYGDLDETGENEWRVAFRSAARLLQQMAAGYHGSLVWDGWDNYHDHDLSWSLYGLVRTGIRAFTPKKRFYAARHVFRFVRPGWHRLLWSLQDEGAQRAQWLQDGLRVEAFAAPGTTAATLVALNATATEIELATPVQWLPEPLANATFRLYRTSRTENCQRIHKVPLLPGLPLADAYGRLSMRIPPESIVTLTTLDDGA
jgi:hypothetical protein